MHEQTNKQIPVPVVIAGIVVVIGLVVFAFFQFLKPSAGGAAEAAAIAEQIKASPNTPTIPRERVMADVVSRGAPGSSPAKGAGMLGGVSKNSGR